jgi:hypothetical protein
MKTDQLKKAVELSSETSCISTVPQTMNEVQHNVPMVELVKLAVHFSSNLNSSSTS